MAARTTTKDGSISDATMLNGSTPWVTGDTLIYSHNITIDIDIDAGVGGATGTTAIAASTSVTGKTLTVNSGVRVICRGNLNLNSSYNGITTLTNNGRISMIPPSGATYVLNLTNNCKITGSGIFDADLSGGGGAPYMVRANDRCQGLSDANGMAFADWGDSTHFGALSYGRNAVSPFDLSIVDCTFTRSSYQFVDFGDYNNNFTFTGNKLVSSVTVDVGGGIVLCAAFNFGSAGTSATWTIDECSFDGRTGFYRFYSRLKVSNCYFGDYPYTTSSSVANSTDCWLNNLVVLDGDLTVANAAGCVKDCYYINTQAGANPHFFGIQDATNPITIDGVVFEATGNGGGDGDGIFPQGGASTLNVTRCLVLPAGDGLTSCNLVSVEASGSTVAQTCNHNTMVATGGECGLMRQNHLGGSFAGQIASCRSNLIVSYGTTTGCKAISDSGGGVDGATNAVTNAGYNAFLNPAVNQTCKYNTTTTQATVTGYSRTVISANTAYPNATIGHDDITITADPFVDKTRNLATWGASQGADGTVAGALALLAANPALIAQATTGLIPWVKAGFNVTGAAGLLLQDAGHDGETIGAMGYVAAGGGSTAATLLAIGVI